jgi:TetR/AcrR family transcriptional regulator
MIDTIEGTEKAIIEAATRLFLEKGFASTSTTEIAKVAGCNQAMVHYYFRTKDRLFEAVFADKFEGFVSSIMDISEGDLPFEEKLTQKIGAHFDILMKNPKLPLLFAYELNTNPKRLEAIKEKLGDLPSMVFANFQQELDIEIEKGNIRKMKVIDLIFNIIALNIALFIIGPVLKEFSGISDEYYDGFIKHRKKENVNTILRSLRP